MNCTTYLNNNGTIITTFKKNNDAFHKRLQNLYPFVDDVSKLPQVWSSESKAHPIGLSSGDLGCYFRNYGRRDDGINDKNAAAVRTDHFISPSCLLYYFEIKLISKGREGFMGIGLTSSQVLLSKLPGWARESYGYHADDGNIFNGDGRGHPFGPTFTTGDVIGCGYNLVEGKCFFTKNGLNLGVAFDDMPSNILLYPTIGLKTSGEEIYANFGQEDFVYDIEQDLRSLRKQMTSIISNYPINDFSDWQTTVHKLVQSWLLQNNYSNTAEAFTKSTNIDCKENIRSIQQRYKIQQLVLNGKISEAIKLTHKRCPNLLQNNPNLLFALKCRQFVELISGAESDYYANFNYYPTDTMTNYNLANRSPSNGNSATNVIQQVGDRIELNGEPSQQKLNDQISHNNHLVQNSSTCNGMIVSDNGDNKPIAQRSISSSSLQELMDIDQPVGPVGTAAAPASATAPTTFPLSDNAVISENHQSSIININNSNLKQETNFTISQQQQQSPIKSELNGTQPAPGEDSDIDPDQKFALLLQFGRELSNYLQQLDKVYGENETNEKLLKDTISLIAFTNPEKSQFGNMLNPSEREPISQLLNSSIVKAEMGDSYRPPMEEVVGHLRKLVRLNDSHGRWLVDRLY